MRSTSYRVDPDYGGILNGHRYAIDDSDESEEKWRLLLVSFSKEFHSEAIEDVDYDFPDWHHGTLSLSVYLYNCNLFRDGQFVNRIKKILNEHGNCFAQFECYDNRSSIGLFQIYLQETVFNINAEQTGLLNKVISGWSD